MRFMSVNVLKLVSYLIATPGTISLQTKQPTRRLTRLLTGSVQSSLSDMYNASVVRKAAQITDNQSHSLHVFFQLLPSGRCY